MLALLQMALVPAEGSNNNSGDVRRVGPRWWSAWCGAKKVAMIENGSCFESNLVLNLVHQ